MQCLSRVPGPFRLALCLLVFYVGSCYAGELPALGARQKITVSGISSGGYMAMQYHFAHSARVAGAGIVAAGPYECAEDSYSYFNFFLQPRIYPHCMNNADGHLPPSTEVSVQRVTDDADAGLIDPTSELAGDRVLLISGTVDDKVKTLVVEALEKLYDRMAVSVQLNTITGAGHAMITGDEDFNASPCNSSDSPYINHCEGEDAPESIFEYLFPEESLKQRAAAGSGEVVSFDQSPYKKATGAYGLSDTGYLFIPTGCREGGCRLHVAFHGCAQSADDEAFGMQFVEHAGYNRWAESNKIIVLYPQTTSSLAYAVTDNFWWPFELMNNPYGCWDWWGYDSDDYATREGDQIEAVNMMVSKLLGVAE